MEHPHRAWRKAHDGQDKRSTVQNALLYAPCVFGVVMRDKNGFTLIEVLVAIAILGIGLGVILELFSGGLRSARIAEEYAAPFRRLNIPENTANVYGMVANIDENMGRLASFLAQKNLSGDTIVVFTADHGDMLGAHSLAEKHKHPPAQPPGGRVAFGGPASR